MVEIVTLEAFFKVYGFDVIYECVSRSTVNAAAHSLNLRLQFLYPGLCG
jgi:hypothetical protein